MAIPFSVSRGGRFDARRLSSRSRHLRRACLRALGTIALVSILGGVSLTAQPAGYSARKQQARDQFDKAEQMREALNGLPASERTRKEYQHVADAYRKVYYVAPMSSKADASVVAVAEILAEMGRQFPPGEKDFHAAIGEYEFLRREYPGSKYRFQALFTIAPDLQGRLRRCRRGASDLRRVSASLSAKLAWLLTRRRRWQSWISLRPPPNRLKTRHPFRINRSRRFLR